MAITKRPKRVLIKVRKETVINCYSSYQCPQCHTVFEGYGPAGNVTRFYCNCGQELIVDKREEV